MTVRSEESMVPESVATWSLDLFLLPGLPLETRWLPGQRS